MINYRFYKLVLGIAIGASIASNYNNFVIANNIDNTIGVTIINTYSASIAWGPSANVIPSGGYYWSSGIQTFINVSASTGSSYTLYGGSTALTGIGVGLYTNTELILLGSGDYSTSFQADFLRDSEPYSSNVLELRVDRTPPTIPIIISPLDNTIVSSNSPLTIAWSNSIDSGIGTVGYWLHLSLHPSFIGETVIWVTSTGTQLAPNSLPLGTMYWYIEAVDGLGNSSQSSAGFFHYTTPTIVNTGSSGTGGTNSTVLIQDNCPGGDFSPSYYDNTCGSAPTQTGTITTGTISGTGGVTTTGGTSTGTIVGTGGIPTTGDNTIDSESIGGSQSGINTLPETTTLKSNLIQGNQKAQGIKPIKTKAPSIYRKYNNINTITNPYLYKSLLNTYWKGVYLVGVDYNMVYISRIVVAFIQVSMRVNTLLHAIVGKYLTKETL